MISIMAMTATVEGTVAGDTEPAGKPVNKWRASVSYISSYNMHDLTVMSVMQCIHTIGYFIVTNQSLLALYFSCLLPCAKMHKAVSLFVCNWCIIVCIIWHNSSCNCPCSMDLYLQVCMRTSSWHFPHLMSCGKLCVYVCLNLQRILHVAVLVPEKYTVHEGSS